MYHLHARAAVCSVYHCRTLLYVFNDHSCIWLTGGSQGRCYICLCWCLCYCFCCYCCSCCAAILSYTLVAVKEEPWPGAASPRLDCGSAPAGPGGWRCKPVNELKGK
jgi:hypothetical protein